MSEHNQRAATGPTSEDESDSRDLREALDEFEVSGEESIPLEEVIAHIGESDRPLLDRLGDVDREGE